MRLKSITSEKQFLFLTGNKQNKYPMILNWKRPNCIEEMLKSWYLFPYATEELHLYLFEYLAGGQKPRCLPKNNHPIWPCLKALLFKLPFYRCV